MMGRCGKERAIPVIEVWRRLCRDPYTTSRKRHGFSGRDHNGRDRRRRSESSGLQPLFLDGVMSDVKSPYEGCGKRPSAAKATLNFGSYGAAEAVPSRRTEELSDRL